MAQREAYSDSGLPSEIGLDIQRAECHPHIDNLKPESASHIIVPYLLHRVNEFRRLDALRKAGWSNPEGDAFFRRQRQASDTCDEKTAYYFYLMMKRIGKELQKSTKALKIHPVADGEPPKILDMCMAPGGFLATVLEQNPTSRALAFSLPVSSGGHEVLLPSHPHVEQRLLDITMLAADMGVDNVPQDHPDAENFMPRQLRETDNFDLVLCDGQVLRTHIRLPYRENREARRLASTQMALGLEHLRPGGTMVVLLHRLEAWDTVKLLRVFHDFSSVRLFKPRISHAKRSSFYMIATGVQSQHPEALRAVERWKTWWRVATFGSDEECQELFSDRGLGVEQVLEQFGPELIRLGKRIWKVQADALEHAPFIRNK